MRRMALRQATADSALLSFALALSVPAPAPAQGRGRVKPPTDAPRALSADSLNNLKFRNLGPSVAGGRVAAVVGVPGDRSVYYVGAAAGGGKTWQKVLFVNDSTGAADLVMVPGNPRLLFAGMWQFVRRPWELVSGGAGSGVYRSKDGGLTWERLTQGLPSGLTGNTAVAVGPTNPSHIYALIETTDGMLWDSKDQGDHWAKVSDFHGLSARPFYFSLMHVSPVDDRKLFFSSYLLLRSDDGGKTTTPIDRGVHVDHHALWIDPQNPDRMIQGNDGGVYVTENGAKSWRFLNNLPIGQFYMVAADNNTPYMLCGGLQDNNAWCGPSSSVGGGGGGGGGGAGGGLNSAEWFTVAGGDGEYAVPAPSDSSILYVGSQNRNITRVDLKTGLNRSIRPYLPGVKDMKPATLPYRFNWTSPIAVSPRDAKIGRAHV